MWLRQLTKHLGNSIGLILVGPLGLLVRLEEAVGGSLLFRLFGQSLALAPGLPGVILRRCYYHWTLRRCSLNCHIGFGAIIHHRTSELGSNAYIGDYALAGSVRIGKGSLVGSRVSLLSGGRQHELDENGHWTPFVASKSVTIQVGDNVWIGEGAIVMADIGPQSMVAAGAVVGVAVPGGVMVAGNPARFVRRLEHTDDESETNGDQPSLASPGSFSARSVE